MRRIRRVVERGRGEGRVVWMNAVTAEYFGTAGGGGGEPGNDAAFPLLGANREGESPEKRDSREVWRGGGGREGSNINPRIRIRP